jgi:hypothetical protein
MGATHILQRAARHPAAVGRALRGVRRRAHGGRDAGRWPVDVGVQREGAAGPRGHVRWAAQAASRAPLRSRRGLRRGGRGGRHKPAATGSIPTTPGSLQGEYRAGGRVRTPSRVAPPVGRHQLHPQGRSPLTIAHSVLFYALTIALVRDVGSCQRRHRQFTWAVVGCWLERAELWVSRGAAHRRRR